MREGPLHHRPDRGRIKIRRQDLVVAKEVAALIPHEQVVQSREHGHRDGRVAGLSEECAERLRLRGRHLPVRRALEHRDRRPDLLRQPARIPPHDFARIPVERSAGATLLALLFLLTPLSAGAGQAGGALTNDDIIKMVRAQLSTDVILTTIGSAQSVKFDVSPTGLIALKDAKVDDGIIKAMQDKVLAQQAGEKPPDEKSAGLAGVKEPDAILRTFKTMVVNAVQTDERRSRLWHRCAGGRPRRTGKSHGPGQQRLPGLNEESEQ